MVSYMLIGPRHMSMAPSGLLCIVQDAGHADVVASWIP